MGHSGSKWWRELVPAFHLKAISGRTASGPREILKELTLGRQARCGQESSGVLLSGRALRAARGSC